MSLFESQSLAVSCAGEELWLHPAHVMFWPAQRILFAADLHVGKEHAFGRHGIAMPGGISEANLQQLFKLAQLAGAQSLIVLGDFMHAMPVQSEGWITELTLLLDSHPSISVTVVAGNHDKRDGRKLIDQRVTWHKNSLYCKPFVLQHEPGQDERGFVLCGHLHPAWRIGKARRNSVRTPAFWFREHYAVLPAFGEFTGGVVVDANPKTDRLYMATSDCVIEVPVVIKG